MYNFVNKHCVILAHNSILYCSIRYCACHNELINLLVIIGKYIVYKTILSNVFFVVLNIICYPYTYSVIYLNFKSYSQHCVYITYLLFIFCFNPYSIKFVHLFSYVCAPIRVQPTHTLHADTDTYAIIIL